MTAPPLVVGLGELLWDRFPEADRLGGAPANFAFHARQLGARARIASRVGADADGDRLRAELARRGMEVAGLQRDETHPTGVVHVRIRNGQPDYVIATNAAWDYLAWTAEFEALAAAAQAVCFGTLAQRHPASRATLQRFVRAVRPTSLRIFDVNLRQAFYDREAIEFGLQTAAILKLNGEELTRIAEIFGGAAEPDAAIARLFGAYPLQLVALTKGAEGCELHTRQEKVVAPAPPALCRDAVGAGDAFAAALVMGRLAGRPLADLARQANRVGAYVAGQPGAMCDLPRELISA